MKGTPRVDTKLNSEHSGYEDGKEKMVNLLAPACGGGLASRRGLGEAEHVFWGESLSSPRITEYVIG